MSSHPARLQYLLQQYADNNCTRRELLELLQTMEQAGHDEALHNSLQQIWQNISASDALPDIDKEKIFDGIMAAAPLPATTSKKLIWMKAAAAAIIILVAGWAIYAGLDKKTSPQQVVADNNLHHDIAPGGDRAILTLSDGSTIILDSAQNGTLAKQGNTSVSKSGSGQLAYTPATGGQPAAILYNTLRVPRGGQYRIVLPDGTKVWLNAASSLKYPTSFTGKERLVELTGEAYFEVTSLPSGTQPAGKGEKKMPFIVNILPTANGANGGRVEVLGTHFNINAYGDEDGIKTTLLEGKVKVSSMVNGHPDSYHESMLQPGQQAFMTHVYQSSATIPVQTADIDLVMAWKNGFFYFRSADIYTVMRQLSRWYDIEVAYNAGPLTERFYAKIPRNTPLSDVLKALTMTGKVHFDITDKKVTVLP